MNQVRWALSSSYNNGEGWFLYVKGQYKGLVAAYPDTGEYHSCSSAIGHMLTNHKSLQDAARALLADITRD